MRTLGIVLIVVGIAMFIIRGFTYNKKEKVLDVGPLEVNKTEKEYVGWPVYAGGVAVLAGIIILATSKKNS